MKKYSWSFTDVGNEWDEDTFDSIDECIEAARQENQLLEEHSYKTVFIGENVPFVPTVHVESILDYAQEQIDFIDYDVPLYDYKKKDELYELEKSMTTVLHDWLRKYEYYPKVYSIENVKKWAL